VDLEAIRRYRAAVFSHRLTAQLAEARGLGSTPDWLSALDLVRPALGADDMPSDFASFTDDDEVARIAARITLLVSEVQLVRFGTDAGYYPADLRMQTLTLLERDAEPTLARLVVIAERSSSVRNLADSFTELQVFWAEAATPEMRRCVQLVAFASDQVWRREIDEVDALATHLRQNPSLNLSVGEADDLSWALTGAEDLLRGGVLQPNPGAWQHAVDLSWSAAFRAFSSEDSAPRVEQLVDVRSSILSMQEFMSDDPSVSSTGWLLASGRDVAAERSEPPRPAAPSKRASTPRLRPGPPA
jgi:hypothetical protein